MASPALMPGAKAFATRRLVLRQGGRCLWAVAVLGCTALGAQAQGPGEGSMAPGAEGREGREGRAWLQRIGQAATQVNYQGTMVFSAGGQVSMSRVTRYCMGPNHYEQSETMDGPARLIYRHNQVVHTFWPSKKVAVIEQREALSPFPALPVSDSQALAGQGLDGYDIKLEGLERVAGHRAQALLLAPKDGARFAQRLWADLRTGLMLRADVLDAEGRVLESSGFSDLNLRVKAQPESILGPMHRLDGYRVVKASITRTKLEEEGWRLVVPLPGFRQISCVTRPLDGGETRPGGPTILQAIYSDGLVHVSIFIEPFNPERHKPMMSSWGATHALAEQRDGRWITVMGDVPIDTIKRFAVALEKWPTR